MQAKKLFLKFIGIISFILGVIGIFVPLLPTTPFILLSAWSFYNSSPRFHNWLVHHPYFGKMIRDWQKSGAIATNAKVIATITLLISVLAVSLKVDNPLAKYAVLVFLILLMGFIITRPKA